MYKTNFVRITEDGKTSLHDEFPLTQSHDIVLRYQVSKDGRPMNAQVVPNGSNHVAEPIFTLRAGDPMASWYVRHYAEMINLNGGGVEKVISARSTAEAMRHWKKNEASD